MSKKREGYAWIGCDAQIVLELIELLEDRHDIPGTFKVQLYDNFSIMLENSTRKNLPFRATKDVADGVEMLVFVCADKAADVIGKATPAA